MNLLNVEVFSTGKWKGYDFNDDILNSIVKNTNELIAKNQRFPIKLGHSEKQIFEQKDGQPSLGWIDNLKKVGSKIVADFKEIPQILFEAIEKGLFKKVSIELNHDKNLGWYSDGLAILGAELPVVKDLKDLQAYFSEEVAKTSSGRICFSEPIFNNEKETLKMSEIEKSEVEKLQKQLLEMKAENAKLEAEKLKFSEEKKQAIFSEQKENLLAKYKKDVDEGKLAPKYLKQIESEVESQRVNFSEEKELTLSAKTFESIIAGYQEAGMLFSEKAKAGSTKEETSEDLETKISNGIAKVMSETGKSYEESSTLFFSANKDLEKKYFSEVNAKIKFNEV